MVKEISRNIKREVERELWARAAGRCQFEGCNKILYRSPVTQESINISEKAHIYSFSEKGPRGRKPLKSHLDELNKISNLMLVCHDCHKTIDEDKEGQKYSASLLQEWKRRHEERVRNVTSISPDKSSYVVLYHANIGEEKSLVPYNLAVEAMFPERYPTPNSPIEISMNWQNEDSKPNYWAAEKTNLETNFRLQIRPLIDKDKKSHFSIFAFAPQPLLIRLGSLFTDKISVDVYQPIREPKSWSWQQHVDNFNFIVNKPKTFNQKPVLVFSLSGKIKKERITSVIGKKIDIWEITVNDDFLHNDFMRSKMQLSLFRQAVRKLMVKINHNYGHATPLYIFPAMPASCAVEMGRVRMPKADMPWVIYDHNNKEGKFIKAIKII